MKEDSKTTKDWQEALDYSENLVHAEYTDWRLPNTRELQSIGDYSYAPDAEDPSLQRAAIDKIFGLTEMESWFWSSTSHGDNPAFATSLSNSRFLA